MFQLNDWDTQVQNFVARATRRLRLDAIEARPYQGFPPCYRSQQIPTQAGRDSVILQSIRQTGKYAVDFRTLPKHRGKPQQNLRIFTREERPLDELMPLLSNLGLRVVDQSQFEVEMERCIYYIRSFIVETTEEGSSHFETLKGRLKSALSYLLAGEIENDALNQLIVAIICSLAPP
jgi:glutamate dehydrogenase